MIITIISDNYNTTTNGNGTVATTVRFVENLRARGHTVRVVAIGVEGKDMFAVPAHYIPIVSPISAKYETYWGNPDKKILTKAIQGADVVHLYLPWKLQRGARKIAKKLNVPVCAAFHCQPENITWNIGLGKFEFVNNFIYWLFKKRFYRFIDNIHCPSQFVANELRNHGYKAKMHVISNGIGEQFKLPEVRPENKDGLFNIMVLGRNAPEKRKDLVIKAVNLSKHRDKIQLHIAGKGPLDDKLAKLGATLPNPAKMGFVPMADLVSTLQSMDLCVHASDIDLEAITVIEQMACGVVPIISNSPKSASGQFALDERSLFNFGDVKELAAKIDYWIENADERKRMNIEYAKNADNYRMERTMQLTEEFYKQTIADHQTVTSHRKTTAGKRMKKRTASKNPLKKAYSVVVYYGIMLPVLYIANRLALGLKIKGRKNLELLKGGAVTVSNHVHVLDSSMAAIALWPKKALFTTLPTTGRVTKMLGGVPVPTTPSESSVFYYELSKRVASKKVVHFYPEGSLSEYSSDLREFKRGAFHLAVLSNAPVLPLLICYREPKGIFKLYKKKRPCITIKIGKPVYPNTKLLQKDSLEDLQVRVTKAMTEMRHEENRKPKTPDNSELLEDTEEQNEQQYALQ
ncbi:MAG: glycosyltransferase [Firmicutes bacterium]|nr:glycosyltransferase [Bacillota bacterium]